MDENKKEQEQSGEKQSTGTSPQSQSNAPAIIAVIVLLLAAVFLVFFLMQDMDEEIDDEDETVTEEVDEDEEQLDSLATLVSTDPDFATLYDAVLAADEAEGVDLVAALDGEEDYTVFAPTNQAFEALPEGELDALLEEPEELAEVLQYHIVEGSVWADDVAELDGEEVETLQGGTLRVEVPEEGVVTLNEEVTVMETDIEASNGVVHTLDGVLLP